MVGAPRVGGGRNAVAITTSFSRDLLTQKFVKGEEAAGPRLDRAAEAKAVAPAAKRHSNARPRGSPQSKKGAES